MCDGINLMIYDPLALNNRVNEIKRIMWPFINRMYNHYLKYKINLVRDQWIKWSYCGLFCVRFIMAIISGIDFKTITGFNDVIENEKLMKTFEKNLIWFDII